MNFKKFISGVSALAIAASAFAGLAVTASAATEEVYLNEDFSSYSGETAIAEVGTEYTWGNIIYKANGRSGAFAGTASFTSSNDLQILVTRFSGNSRGAVLTFASTAGIPTVSDLDSDAILRLSFKLKASSGAFGVSGFGTLKPEDLGTNGSSYSTVVIDLNKATNQQTVTVNDSLVSVADLSASTFTGLNFTDTTGTSNSTNVYMYFDDIKVEQVEYAQSSVAVNSTVQAKCGDTLLSETDIAGYAGETYSYSPYAYIEKAGVFYKYDSIGSNGEVNQVSGLFAENMEPVVVSYSVASDVVAYAEVNVANRNGGHGAFAGAADNSIASGGKDGGTVYGQEGSHCLQTFNAPVTGKYNITVNAVGTASNNRSCYLAVDSTDTADSLGTLACNNGATAKTTVEVELTAGSHTFYYLSTGSISPRLDYMVVELVEEYKADLKATVDDQDTVNGTEEYAADEATWFVVTVKNDGTAEGAYNVVKVTDGTDTYQASTPNAKLAAGAKIVYGGIIEGAYTFTDASVE